MVSRWPREHKNLVAVVRPGPKGQVALLAVKGEVGDVHHAGAFGDGGGVPRDLAVVAQLDVGVHRPGKVVVGSAAAEGRQSFTTGGGGSQGPDLKFGKRTVS